MRGPTSPPQPSVSDVIASAFPNAHPDTRQALVRAAIVRDFGGGQIILRQGDGVSLALVIDGHVASRRTNADGRQLIIRILGRGGLVPIMSLSARPAAVDALALTACSAAVWRAQDVRSLANSDPSLALDILDQVLATFEDVVGYVDGLLYQDAVRRVARALYLHAHLFFDEQPVLTRAHLPSLVGTSREMTGRVLRVLESRSIVARSGRDRLRLIDAAALAAAADAGGIDAGPPRNKFLVTGAGS